MPVADEPLACVLVRSGQDPVVVNLDLANRSSSPKMWRGSTRFIRNRTSRQWAIGDGLGSSRDRRWASFKAA